MADVIGNNYTQPQYGEGAQTFGPLAAFLQGQQDTYNTSARQYQDMIAQKQAETEMALKQQQAQSYAAQVDAQTRETNARIPGLQAQGEISQQQASAPSVSTMAGGDEATAQANWARISPTLPESVKTALSNTDGSLNTKMLQQYAGNQNLSPSATKVVTNSATNQRARDIADTRYQQGVDVANIRGNSAEKVAGIGANARITAAQIAANAARDRQSLLLSFKDGHMNIDQTIAGAESRKAQLEAALTSGDNSPDQAAQLMKEYKAYDALSSNLTAKKQSFGAYSTTQTPDFNNMSTTTTRTPVAPSAAARQAPMAAAPTPQAQQAGTGFTHPKAQEAFNTFKKNNPGASDAAIVAAMKNAGWK